MWIYKITNKINGKAYVGQTSAKNPRDRWSAHKSRGCGAGRSAIKCAIEKHGAENFEFIVLHKAESREELDRLEKLNIKDLNTLAPNGYNLMDGGSAPVHSEETKKKLSIAGKGRPAWNKGLTKENDVRLTNANFRKGKDSHSFGNKNRLGIKHTPEAKKKMSESQEGREHSAETKIKMSHSHKKVKIQCLNTNEVFLSIMDAAYKLRLNSGNIHHALKSPRHSVKGFRFKRVD